jgi:hypothetical protein
VSSCGLAIYDKKHLKSKEELLNLKYFTMQKYDKKHLKAKELWNLKYFTMQKYNLHNIFSKRNQNPSRYYNSISNQHKPKYHLSKVLI